MNNNTNALFRSTIADALLIPAEIMSEQAYITLIGNKQITVENYKNIIEYNCNTVRLNTKCGVIKISGCGLFMKQMTCEDILINGTLTSLEFIFPENRNVK